MSNSYQNPFANDPFNPYAAPEVRGYATDNSQQRPDLASRSQRFTGALIDGLLMLPLVAGMVYFMSISAGGPAGASAESSFLISLISIPVSIAWFLILHGYLLANRGQTIGKMAVGTQIVDAQTGQLVPLLPLFFKRNISIQLLSMIPIVGSFVALADALLIFRESRKCLHDEIAGTRVIVYQPRQ